MKSLVFRACFFLLSPLAFAINLDAKYFLDFEIGALGAIDTRIVDMSDYGRSNFVFQDCLAGLDFMALFGKQNGKFGAYAELSALYPLRHSFNKMVQKYSNVMNFSVSSGLGGFARIPLGERFRLETILGLRYNHLHEDRFLYHTVGATVGAGFGVITLKERKKRLRYTFEPDINRAEISKAAQAVMLRYSFSLDFADVGTNRSVEPLKVRYSHCAYLSYTF